MEHKTTSGVRIEAKEHGNTANRKMKVNASFIGHEPDCLVLEGNKVFWTTLEAHPKDYTLLTSSATGIVHPDEDALGHFLVGKRNNGCSMDEAVAQAAIELEDQIKDVVQTVKPLSGEKSVIKPFNLQIPGDSDE